MRMSWVGICGSDVSLAFKGKLADYELEPPLGVGHEASGVVAKCGSGVKNLKAGQFLFDFFNFSFFICLFSSLVLGANNHGDFGVVTQVTAWPWSPEIPAVLASSVAGDIITPARPPASTAPPCLIQDASAATTSTGPTFAISNYTGVERW